MFVNEMCENPSLTKVVAPVSLYSRTPKNENCNIYVIDGNNTLHTAIYVT